MNIFDAIILGLVQGLTEFLPVSSSGHLVLAQNLLGINEPDIIFEIFLHFATLIAIIVYFKNTIFALRKHELVAVVVASIPVAVIGLLFEDQLKALFSSSILVAILLIVTGIVNLITDRKLEKENIKEDLKEKISYKEAFIIGFFQAFAILPGISRSGLTVAGGIWQNIEREKAFKFSFIMVIPVIFGVSLVQLLEVFQDGNLGTNNTNLLVGGLVAFVTGLLSLRLFEYVIKRARMEIFGYYCIILGFLSLLAIYI